MALEDYHLLGRHTCSECNERMQKRWGCRKPGMDFEGNKAFILTSPMMHEAGEATIRECPTGRVLRETPYIYRAIAAAGYVENGAVNPYTLSHWCREAMQVVSSERSRLREIENENRKLDNDRAYGRRALKAV